MLTSRDRVKDQVLFPGLSCRCGFFIGYTVRRCHLGHKHFLLMKQDV
jgi:hypothetical protein